MNALSRTRSRPRVLATHRFPSRSSNREVTDPRRRAPRGASSSHHAVAETQDGTGRRPDPDVRVAVLEHGQRLNVGKRRWNTRRRHRRSGPPDDTLVSSNPQRAVLIRQQAVDLPVRQALHDRRDASSAKVDESRVARAKPHLARRRVCNGYDNGLGKHRRIRDDFEPATNLAHGAGAHRRCQQAAIASTGHRGDERVGRRIVRPDGDKLVGAIAQQRRTRQSDPKVAVGVCHQSEDGAQRGLPVDQRLHHAERHAVEANQALLRAQPQIAVGRLRDGIDQAARKPLLAAPDIVDVLRHVPMRVNRTRRLQRAQHEGHDQAWQHTPTGGGPTGGTRTSQ